MIFIFAIMKTRREKNRSSAVVFSCCKPESVIVAGARWRGQQEPDWLSVHFSAPFDFLVVQRGKPMPAQHSATHFGTIRAVQCVRFSRFRNAAERIPTGRLECASAMGPSCGAYWTSTSSSSTSVWPSGQSGFSFQRPHGENQSSYSFSLENSLAGENQSSYSLIIAEYFPPKVNDRSMRRTTH